MSDDTLSGISKISRREVLRTVTGAAVVGSAATVGSKRAAAEPGDQQWAFETEDFIEGSPTIVDGTVFVGSADNNLYALDTETGEQEWAYETGGRIRSAPTVVGGMIFIGSYDGKLYAVDAETGEQEWTYRAGENIYGSATVVNETFFFGSLDNRLYAVGAETGSEEWTFETGDTVDSSPTIIDGTVYFGSYDDNLYAVDADSGEQKWAYETDDNIAGGVTVVDETVYLGSDYGLEAINIDGERQWRFPMGAVWTTPTVRNGTVFVSSNDHSLYAVNADTGSEKWVFETDDRIWSSPTIASGTAFVGGLDDYLYAVDADTGEEQWAFETGNMVRSSPTVANGTVYFGSDDDNLYAVDAGVEGSSNGSRVLLGTLGHHGEWRFAREPPDSPVTAPLTTWAQNNIALLGIGGGVTGGGYAAWWWRSNRQARSGQPDETRTEQPEGSKQDDVLTEPDVETTVERENASHTIEDISGVGESKADKLRAAGYDSIGDITTATKDELSNIEGIGTALAGRIHREAGSIDSAETSTPNNSESTIKERKAAAETAVETATSAKSSRDFSAAVVAYRQAKSEYQAALNLLAPGDTEQRTEIQQALESIRSELETVTTLQEHQNELIEVLKPAERSFKEAVVASIDGDQTIARIRFRQARDGYEDVHEILTDSENGLLTESIEVSVQPDRELPSLTISELPVIPKPVATALADAGIKTVDDLDSSAELPWTPPVVENIDANEPIGEEIVTTLTLLSWWYVGENYTFETVEAVSRRQQQADYGFDHMS